MRLPFLQMESDLISHGAAEVSHLAGCSIPQALGHIAMVRAWAVSRATDEAPPDGWVEGDSAGRRIEAAAHWTGEKGALLQALLDAGHVAEEPGGLRVRHLEPYAQAWEKNRTAKERMRTLRERSANKRERAEQETGTDGEGSATFRQQTQTQTQKEASASQADASASPPPGDDLPDATEAAEEVSDRPALVLEAPEPPAKKPRDTPPGEVLYSKLEECRRAECERTGAPFVPSRWAFSRQNKELGPIARLPDGHEDKERFQAAWGAYCDDPIALTREPPFSLDYFWKARTRYEGRAVLAVVP